MYFRKIQCHWNCLPSKGVGHFFSDWNPMRDCAVPVREAGLEETTESCDRFHLIFTVIELLHLPFSLTNGNNKLKQAERLSRREKVAKTFQTMSSYCGQATRVRRRAQ